MKFQTLKLLIALIMTSSVAAHAGQFYLDSVTPRGAQCGTTVDVVFHGNSLNDPQDVLFYRQGIELVSIEKGEKETVIGKYGTAKNRDTVKAKLKIASNCPLGEHPIRLRTSYTLSECVTFWITPFPVVEEAEKKLGDNDTIDKAQAIQPNTTVAGMILNGEVPDRDCYKVELKKGQRLSAEIAAVRLGSVHVNGENDLTLRVFDPKGKVIARNDDSAQFVQDPALSIAIPEDGAYTVEVSQQMFQSVGSGYYLLHVGTFLRPAAIYPLGGQPGQKLEAKIIGDPLGASSMSIQLPQHKGDFESFTGKPGETPPTANVLRVSDCPNTLEIEPNDTPQNATPVAALPAALNGIIEKEGDVDCFRFKVEKGSSWRVRVYARALGTPLDPRIWIRPLSAADGANEVEKDDSTIAERDHVNGLTKWHPKETLDPSVVFTPKLSGDYVLGIEDQRGEGGPAYAYRIEIEPVENHVISYMLQTGIYNYQYSYHFDIPQGGRLTRIISLAGAQGNTFNGPMELEAVGLPKGVKMIAPRFKNLTSMPVQFVAEPGAELSASLVELRARPVDPAIKLKSGSAQGISYIDRRLGAAWHFLFVDKLAFAVVKGAPFEVELVQPEISLAQNGELALNVKLKRNGDFNEPVEIQTDWLPSGVTRESAVTIPAGQSEGKFVIHASDKAPAGIYQISMTANTQGKDASSGLAQIKVATGSVNLTVSEPYLSIKIHRSAVERGQKGQIVCDVKINKEFPGKASAVLKRLPAGIKLIEPLPEISAKDTTATFQIEASMDSLVGQYKEIFCEVVVVENGQTIRQQTGSGILRIDPARTAKTSLK